MTSREQQRAQVLPRLLVGDMTAAEAALLLGLSERPVFRLRAGNQRDGEPAPGPSWMDPGSGRGGHR